MGELYHTVHAVVAGKFDQYGSPLGGGTVSVVRQHLPGQSVERLTVIERRPVNVVHLLENDTDAPFHLQVIHEERIVIRFQV